MSPDPNLRTKHKIFIAKSAYQLIHLARALGGKSDRAAVKRSGIEWELDLAEGIDFSIYLLGAFEPQTIKFYETYIKPGDVVLDIGANIGAHTLPLAKLVGGTGKVFGFEPTFYAFHKLVKNISLNKKLAPRIEVKQAMLVASDSDVVEPEIYSSWPLENTGAVHKQHRGKLMETSGAVALTLDKAVDLSGITKIDFIKLDVDGHEFEVLTGGMATLEKFRPTILMELEPCLYAEKRNEFDSIILMLNRLNGRMTDVNTGTSLSLDADVLWELIPEGASRNVLIRFFSFS